MKLTFGATAAAVIAIGLGCSAWPRSAGALPVCPLQWYVSYGGNSSFVLLNTDPDGLPLSALRFSRSYNDPTDLSHGYLDFDRDGKSDVFSAVPIAGGFYQWRYMSGGKGSWIDLAFDDTPPDDLRFGDFNGDGYTDVFSIVYDVGLGAYQWRYSSQGTASYKNLAYAGYTIDQLRFGDFNGDGRTDVFALQYLGAGSYAWLASLSGMIGGIQYDGGSTSFVQINSAPTLLDDLAFGDLDGNGHTDVFTTVVNPAGGYDWIYSPNGIGAYQTIASSRPQTVHDVVLAGNFDPSTPDIVLYHGTDVFYTTPRVFDGTNQWWDAYYKPSPYTFVDNPLAYDTTPPADLRFADFDGDGVTDVFVLAPCDRIFGSDF